MKRLKVFSRVFHLVLGLALISVTGCENGNLFGKINDVGGGNDITTLQSDAAIALDRKDYAGALALYERILAQDPHDPTALYGSTVASLANAGFDIGSLVSNLVRQSNSAPTVMGLQDLVDQGRIGATLGSADVDSLLNGLNLESLDSVIDVGICRMRNLITASAYSKARFTAQEAYLSLGVLYLLRAAVRPINANFFDIVNTNGNFVLTPKGDFNTICGNPANEELISQFATDAASAYAAFSVVQTNKNLPLDTIIGRLTEELDQFINESLDHDGNHDLPDACRTIINAAGIDENSFRNYFDGITPLTSAC